MKADVLLKSNAIFDGKKYIPEGGCIAVKSDRIIGVGSLDQEKCFTGSGTKIIDMGEKLIMPGFHDNHNHIYLSMIFSSSVFLGDAKSEKEAAELLKEKTLENDNSEWILGYGWHQAKWDNQVPPTYKSLDRYYPDKPVFLMHETGHAAWVNSVTLQRYGITKDTKDPKNGRFVRDEHGNPTGFILEDAYVPIASDAFMLEKSAEKKALRDYLKKAAEFGLTSIDDMFYIMGLELGNPDLYREFEENGELSLRINFYKKITRDIDKLKFFKQYRTPKVYFQGCKMFMDGVASTYTAFMVDSYKTRKCFYGEPFHSEEDVLEMMKAMDSGDYKMRIHAVGDGSVRRVLNAYERLVEERDVKDRRHCIEHIEIIHPNDIDRFDKLGIIPSLQPNHMAITEHLKDNPFLSFLGKEREPYYWIGKTLIDSCKMVTYGTDYPISEQNPMLVVFRAINRVMNDMEPAGGWNPQEKVSLETALRNYTYNGAYSNFHEKELGSLEVGKYADIICLGKNPFREEKLSIKDIKNFMTMVAGEIVFESGKEQY